MTIGIVSKVVPDGNPGPADPLVNDQMRWILDQILADLRKPCSDELPPEDGETDET
ncbi:MAG: hypothetical protein GX616_10680 [Planctomycetes bacterium]|nr:hypothetical protein [Planctomycetota bacterium]